LDAIGLKNGSTHEEIIMTQDGPCLVEMNCHANGRDGNWRPLAQALTVVIKPVNSAGSDGVKLCHDLDEAREHFDHLMKLQVVSGGDCPAVVNQEFLQGKEFIVDHMSCDGVHKTAMVWVNNKCPANGAAFVYFG
jgi:predicted ATP-grasp superfamily ATP-dependent carboligase